MTSEKRLRKPRGMTAAPGTRTIAGGSSLRNLSRSVSTAVRPIRLFGMAMLVR